MFENGASLLAQFSTWLQNRVTRTTIHYYLADVRQHLDWLSQQELAAENVTGADLEQYVSALRTERPGICGRDAPYALTTVARKVSALREFYAEMFAHGQLASNPADKLARPRIPDNRIAIRPWDVQLPQLPANVTPNARHIRDMAIRALAAYERLRIGEITRLNVSDVDLAAGMVRIVGRTPRKAMVFLCQATTQLLTRWLAARRLVKSGCEEAAFVSLHWTSGRSVPGTRISTRSLSKILHAHQSRRGS